MFWDFSNLFHFIFTTPFCNFFSQNTKTIPKYHYRRHDISFEEFNFKICIEFGLNYKSKYWHKQLNQQSVYDLPVPFRLKHCSFAFSKSQNVQAVFRFDGNMSHKSRIEIVEGVKSHRRSRSSYCFQLYRPDILLNSFLRHDTLSTYIARAVARRYETAVLIQIITYDKDTTPRKTYILK